MSQFVVLAKPRSAAARADASFVFRTTDNELLVRAAKLAFGTSDSDAVFTVTSPSGDAFETWFDALPFDAERTDELIDACARSFAALVLFYGDARDLERTNDLDELKGIVSRQFASTPVELCVAWTE